MVADARSEASGRVAPARFLDPAVLARIGNLELLARVVVDGFVSGLHRAVHLGVSPDFAEHRPYAPGDDVRRIDWRVLARTDRLYLKTFEAETNADVMLALDVSASMGFGSGEVSKLDYARFAGASLAWLAGRQRDRIGLATFGSSILELVPPAVGHRDSVLRGLARAQANGPGDLRSGLARLGDRLHRRGIVVVLSDLYAPPPEVGAALDELRGRGQDVIVLQVLDPLERELDLPEPTVLEDVESGERLPVTPEFAPRYRALVAAHLEGLERTCRGRGVDYAVFSSARPLDELLSRYLRERARLVQARRGARAPSGAGAATP